MGQTRREFFGVVGAAAGAFAVPPVSHAEEQVTIRPKPNVSIDEILTDNILIQVEPGSYDTNKYRTLWQLIWDVIHTDGAKVVAHYRIEGPQLTLVQFSDDKLLSDVRNKMHSVRQHVWNNKLFGDVTQVYKKFSYNLGTQVAK